MLLENNQNESKSNFPNVSRLFTNHTLGWPGMLHCSNKELTSPGSTISTNKLKSALQIETMKSSNELLAKVGYRYLNSKVFKKIKSES